MGAPQHAVDSTAVRRHHKRIIEIDGTREEGGGQILRTAVALSLITGQPFRMQGIRAGRAQPGLKAQLLAVLDAARALSEATCDGAFKGSLEIKFLPGSITGGAVSVAPAACVSIPLMLQALAPIAAFGSHPSQIDLLGGTDVAGAMSFDYWREVIGPLLGAITITLGRRGFYPAGGGSVSVHVPPWRPAAVVARGAAVKAVQIRVVASLRWSAAGVAERLLDATREPMDRAGLPVNGSVEYCDCASDGAVVTAIATLASGTRLGADALLGNGEDPPHAGARAASTLLRELECGAAVDVHAVDSLLLWLALGGGEIEAGQLSSHAHGVLYVLRKFLGPTVRVDGSRVRVERGWVDRAGT